MTQPNPYAAPKANVDDDRADPAIDSLSVSDAWKRKFKAIQKAGGPGLPHLKTLSKEDRKAVPMFNILGFLFGPFYYVAKGMWKKGITLFVLGFAVIFVLILVLEALGLTKLTTALNVAMGALYAVLADRDYYKKMVLRQNGWW